MPPSVSTTPRSTSRRGEVVPLSIAPMMDRTDRHFRFFLRKITRRALLYTEMVTTGALLHGDREAHLGFDPVEHPLSLQLGGDDPLDLASCARMAEDRGYDEVNLNVGCPSPRVKSGAFGAVLMRTPERVADAVAAMRDAVSIPITVKHRIGVDELDRYEDMCRFVEIVARAGADRFTVHARKAWLDGLSPKENRNIPPLRYDDVHRLKREYPEQIVELNGGLRSLDSYKEHLVHVDAVMVGRAAWDDPFHLVEVDPELFGSPPPHRERAQVARSMSEYLETWSRRGVRPVHLIRNLFNLYAGRPGTRAWKRTLTEKAHSGAPMSEIVQHALEAVRGVASTTRLRGPEDAR